MEIEPIGRSGHSMLSYKNHLIVFGGLGEVVHEKNDLISFDFETKLWKIAEGMSIRRKNERYDNLSLKTNLMSKL